jgi:hypothetical protein
MNYNEIDELLEKIVNTQKTLAESPPSLPKDPLYIFLRIFFCGIIILGIAVIIFDIAIYRINYQKKVKTSDKTRNFHKLLQICFCIFGFSFSIIFLLNLPFYKTQNIYFVPFELLQLEEKKKEYISKKNRGLRNKKEVLQKVNSMIKNNPKIVDLENAKKFLEKQINVIWRGVPYRK